MRVACARTLPSTAASGRVSFHGIRRREQRHAHRARGDLRAGAFDHSGRHGRGNDRHLQRHELRAHGPRSERRRRARATRLPPASRRHGGGERHWQRAGQPVQRLQAVGQLPRRRRARVQGVSRYGGGLRLVHDRLRPRPETASRRSPSVRGRNPGKAIAIRPAAPACWFRRLAAVWGAETGIAPEVAAAHDTLYADDRARGFKVGTIRGAAEDLELFRILESAVRHPALGRRTGPGPNGARPATRGIRRGRGRGHSSSGSVGLAQFFVGRAILY